LIKKGSITKERDNLLEDLVGFSREDLEMTAMGFGGMNDQTKD